MAVASRASASRGSKTIVALQPESLSLNDLDTALERLLLRAASPSPDPTPARQRDHTSGDPARDQERFWSFVKQIGGPEGCWHWTGSRRTTGEGRFFGSDARHHDARRMAYELIRGSLAGKTLKNACPARDPLCIQPAHWIALSHRPVERAPVREPRRSECPHGHALTPENTYVAPDGYPRCKTCIKERSSTKYRRTVETAGEYVTDRKRPPSLPLEERKARRKAQKRAYDIARRKTQAQESGRPYRPRSGDGPKTYADMISRMTEEERREYMRQATQRGIASRRKKKA